MFCFLWCLLAKSTHRKKTGWAEQPCTQRSTVYIWGIGCPTKQKRVTSISRSRGHVRVSTEKTNFFNIWRKSGRLYKKNVFFFWKSLVFPHTHWTYGHKLLRVNLIDSARRSRRSWHWLTLLSHCGTLYGDKDSYHSVRASQSNQLDLEHFNTSEI